MWRLNGFWTWTSGGVVPPVVTSGLWIGSGLEIGDDGLSWEDSLTVGRGLSICFALALLGFLL